MFIDEVQAMQEHREPLKVLSGDTTDAEHEDMRRQLELLDGLCPRYDVHNVYRVLFAPQVVGYNPVALKRNTEADETRQTLLQIAGKAPLGPPWYRFCLEHRGNEQQRIAYLLRWNKEQRNYVCTVMFDSVQVQGMVEFLPNAFSVSLDDDDMYGGIEFDARLRDDSLECAERAAQLVRTCIELLNWDREDVPTQTLFNPRAQKSTGKKSEVKKSDQTIIKFEPFLKQIRAGVHRGSAEPHAASGQHLVRGHYQNFKYDNPRFGHKPVLGKTYGRLWVKPFVRGNREHGKPHAPRVLIKL